MVDSVSQSINATGKTAVAEKSGVQPKRQYRDMGPLAFAVPASTDSDDKQRFLVGTTGGGWGRLTRAVSFGIILRGRTVNFETMTYSAYEVAMYQVRCYNDERSTTELRAEGRQS